MLLRVGLPAVFGLLWWSAICASPFVCVPALFTHGAVVEHCPAGELVMVPGVEVSNVGRNATGTVTVWPRLQGITRNGLRFDGHPRRVGASLGLRRAGSEDVEPLPAPDDDSWSDDWEEAGNGGVLRQLRLPTDLPDGFHTLVVELDTSHSDDTVEVELPVFAPARIHLLSDRPRYEAGQEVLLRAVVLRARDLTPLEGRPGRWQVVDAEGTLVMDEVAPTGDWGVAAGSFPIAPGAPEGEWTARFVSDQDSGEVRFTVAPFTLPRFSVEAGAQQRWHEPGDRPRVEGSATYASGAPVADAEVSLSWSVTGDWPPPTAWLDGGLPQRAQTDRRGRFVLNLPPIPDDLIGTATLGAAVTVVDPAGDRQQTGVSVLLSADSIAGELVTETGNTLLEGFNNRAWVRLTRPDGTPLPETTLTVRRQWDPTDEGATVQTDEDGVARLQLDPGPPVNIELPTPPVRPTPPPPAVALGVGRDQLGNRSATLGERRALEQQEGVLGDCARWVQQGSLSTSLTLAIEGSGRVRAAVAHDGADTEAGRCLAQAARRLRLPAERDRLFVQPVTLNARDLPVLAQSTSGWPSPPGGLAAQWDALLPRARACLPLDQPSRSPALVLQWAVEAGRQAVELQPAGRSSVSSATASCLQRTLSSVRLERPASQSALGKLELRTTARPSRVERRPTPRTMLGYALALEARAGSEALGTTTLPVSPGVVPSMRLRASPVIAQNKGTVEVELLRGPGFRGELADEYRLVHADGRAILAKRADKERTVRFVLPDEAGGWWSMSAHGTQTRVFVPEDDTLAVSLKPDRPAYAPGDEARLTVRTTLSGAPVEAAVGLIGVDETMGQIAALPGADALNSLRPTVQSRGRAFGALDAAALGRGLIRGENAREAVILQVSSVPSPAALDRPIYRSEHRPFDAEAELVSAFYRVLTVHQAKVRHWERTAPPKDQLTNARNAAIWREALAELESSDTPAVDAFGRPLELGILPGDLLAMADPRMVATDGTRLPEDIDNWTAWVVEESP